MDECFGFGGGGAAAVEAAGSLNESKMLSSDGDGVALGGCGGADPKSSS
jgi:hypothetical protein